jgi:hypothetical protein
MPVSWWAKEIEKSYLPVPPDAEIEIAARMASKTRDPNWRLLVVRQYPTEWYREMPPPFLGEVLQRLRLEPAPVQQADVVSGGPLLNGDATAFPILLALFCNETAKVRRVAIAGLLAQGRKKQKVLPALLDALHDPDAEVRAAAPGFACRCSWWLCCWCLVCIGG